MGCGRRWIAVNVVGVCLLLLVFGGVVGPDLTQSGLGPGDSKSGRVSGVGHGRRARALLQSRRALQQTDRTFARERRRWDAEALQNVGVPVILGRGVSVEDRVLHFRRRGISDFFEAEPEWPESQESEEPEDEVGAESSMEGDTDQVLDSKSVGEAGSGKTGHKGLGKGGPGSVPELIIRDSDSEVRTAETFAPVQTLFVNVTANSTGGAANSSNLEKKGPLLGQGLPLNITGGVATNKSSRLNQSEFSSRDPDFDAHPHILQNVTEAERVEQTTAESEPLTKGAPGEVRDIEQEQGLELEEIETTAPTQPPEEAEMQNPFADPETAPMLVLPPQRSIKVYIYDLPPHLNRDFVTRDPRVRQTMFATEVLIHENFEQSAVRTLDPDEADFYFIPVYTAAVLEDSGRTIPDSSHGTMLEAVMYVAERWPYFNRMRGLDHVVVAPHDYGACFHYRDELASQTKFRMVLRYLTVLQTFGVHNHVCYRPGRSVVIPPYIDVRKLRQLAFAPERDAHEKSVLAFFRGLYIDAGNDATGKVYSRGVRLAIGQTFANHPDFDISDAPSLTYLQDMMRATFCLCPLGWAPWSPRIFESVQIGCIPVIIADDIILPFENYFNWERIAVRVKEADVPRLEEILKGIPPEKVAAMQEAMWDPQVRQALIFPEPAEPGDAFEMILNELEAKVERIRHKRAEYFRKHGQ